MLLIDTGRVFGREFFRGVTKYARLNGPWAFYNNLSFFGQQPRQSGWLKAMDIDGFIVHTTDQRAVDRVLATGCPCAIRGIKGPLEGVINIISDNASVGLRGGFHLESLGLHHFGFCGYPQIDWSHMRETGLRDHLSKRGFPLHVYDPPRAAKKRGWPQEMNPLIDWLRELPKPVGILAANDDRGQQITEACRVANLKVPDEVAVIGVDNDEILCEQSYPTLSSVVRNYQEAGYEAAALLDRWISGEDAQGMQVVVRATHVEQRQSTDVLAIADNEVADAVRFIRSMAAKPIQVEDVLARVYMSRRRLDQKFCEALGHPLYKEITLARIGRIKQQLVETNLSITQIAYNLGFNSPAHLSRYFQRYEKMSPSVFRQQNR